MNTAIAQTHEVEITKTAPKEVGINGILQVTISVKNNLDKMINVELIENLAFGKPIDNGDLVGYRDTPREGEDVIKWPAPDGECETGCKKDGICDLDCRCTVIEDRDCAIFWFPPYYRWTFFLDAGSEKTVGYRVNATQIGRFSIGSSRAITDVGEFHSNSLAVVVRCDGDGICEINRGEYHKNCPEDCKSAGRDNYCNRVLDGLCDPDCGGIGDPDCMEVVCGDGKCESSRGETYRDCPGDCPKPIICGDTVCEEDENYLNCPGDCPSGGEDGYCDALDDGVCDPDCRVDVDVDCPKIFGNGVCEPEFGENHLTCPKDCPPGSQDGYCNRADDGVCDPDCGAGEDPDCGAGSPVYILIILGIITVTGMLIYLKFRRNKE